MVIFVLILLAFVIFMIIPGVLEGVALYEKQRECERLKKLAIETYSNITPKIKIPENCLRVSYMLGKQMIIGTNFVWVKDKSVCFFPSIGCIDWYYKTGGKSLFNFDPLSIKIQDIKFEQLKFEQLSIKVQDILYFERGGEIYHENKISGGGGGGSSIGNAGLGGAIAGGAGAIVASRKKTDPITSELITHDNRVCRLVYLKDNIKQVLVFDYSDYGSFKVLIPEKDISVIDEIRRRNVIDEQTTTQTDVIQKIRDLGTLRDEGILTQEEFEAKKKELLKKI